MLNNHSSKTLKTLTDKVQLLRLRMETIMDLITSLKLTLSLTIIITITMGMRWVLQCMEQPLLIRNRIITFKVRLIQVMKV
jgi:hypothetical protein